MEGMCNVCYVPVFVPRSELDIPKGQVGRLGFPVASEVRELHLIRSTDQLNNCCPWGKSLLCLRPLVCGTHFRIRLITLHMYGPGWLVEHLVFIWPLAMDIP